MISKYKHEIVMAIAMIGFFFAFYYLYGILLPFIIGLILAFSAYPLISKIQKMVRNKDMATTFFLATIVAAVILFFLFLTQLKYLLQRSNMMILTDLEGVSSTFSKL